MADLSRGNGYLCTEKYADIVVDEEGKDLEESLKAVLEIIHNG